MNTFWRSKLTPGQWLILDSKNKIQKTLEMVSFSAIIRATICGETGHHHPYSRNNSCKSQYETDKNPNSCTSSFEKASIEIVTAQLDFTNISISLTILTIEIQFKLPVLESLN